MKIPYKFFFTYLAMNKVVEVVSKIEIRCFINFKGLKSLLKSLNRKLVLVKVELNIPYAKLKS